MFAHAENHMPTATSKFSGSRRIFGDCLSYHNAIKQKY